MEPIYAYAWVEPDLCCESPFVPFAGIVVVEMCGKPERVGGVLVAYRNERIGPDVAKVVAAGEGPSSELRPGDVVLVRHSHGKHMRGVEVSGVSFDNEVRMYGCAAVVGGKAARVPWHKSVPGVLEGGGVRATGDNVIIDRGEVRRTSAGGILLPDDASYRPCIGTVVSVGPKAPKEIAPGMRVVYMATLVTRVEGFGKNLGIVPAAGVLAEVVDVRHQ